MATNAEISVAIVDADGNTYDLNNNLIDFEKTQIGVEKVVIVILHNRSGRIINDITVEAVMHPTAQIGSAFDTYDATGVGLTDIGPWYSILTISSMSVNEKITAYLNWTPPETGLLGAAQFAMEVKGDVIL